MGLLVACKNEGDPIKNEGARVVTTLFINFSDAQGQLTPKSVIESCRNSNSYELLWLGLLSAKMKKIHLKMKVLEWSQHFSHYKSVTFSEVSDRILPKFKLIQALIVVLIVCKNEEDPFKIESTRVVTKFLPL